MLVTRALDKDDQRLLALMTKRVGWRCVCSGLTEWSAPRTGAGQYMIWEIAPRCGFLIYSCGIRLRKEFDDRSDLREIVAKVGHLIFREFC